MPEHEKLFCPTQLPMPYQRSGMRKTGVTSDQVEACRLRVEEGLNNRQIAQKLNVSAQSITVWFKKPAVLKELESVKRHWNGETRHKLRTTAENLRDKGIKKLDERIDDVKTKTAEITGVVKLANDMVERTENQEIIEDEGEQAKEQAKQVMDALEPEEKVRLARRLAFGDNAPIFEDDEVIEVTDATGEADSSGDRDNQGAGT